MSQIEYHTIKIPTHLTESKNIFSNYVDQDLTALPTIIKEYSLKELLKLRDELTLKSNNISKRLSTVKKLTFEYYQSQMIIVRAIHHNLAIVKEVLSMANTYIQSTIFNKSNLEAQRHTYISVCNSLKNNFQAVFKKGVEKEIEDIGISIKQCIDDLEAYNESVKVTVQLIEIEYGK